MNGRTGDREGVVKVSAAPPLIPGGGEMMTPTETGRSGMERSLRGFVVRNRKQRGHFWKRAELMGGKTDGDRYGFRVWGRFEDVFSLC